MSHLIDSAKCIKCLGCVDLCPEGVYQQSEPNTTPNVVRAQLCIRCGQCLMRCPTDAISIPELSLGQLHTLGELPQIEPVANLLRGRRSIRCFEKKQVERALLKELISLAAAAPSFHNYQITEFVVIQNPETLKLIEERTTKIMMRLLGAYKNVFTRPLVKKFFGKQFDAAIALIPSHEFVIKEQLAGRSRILCGAPAIIVFHGQKGKLMALESAQLCIQNAFLAMPVLGLGGFYCGRLTLAAQKDKQLLKMLQVPDTHELFGVIAVGHPKVKLNRWIERKEPRIDWG